MASYGTQQRTLTQQPVAQKPVTQARRLNTMEQATDLQAMERAAMLSAMQPVADQPGLELTGLAGTAALEGIRVDPSTSDAAILTPLQRYAEVSDLVTAKHWTYEVTKRAMDIAIALTILILFFIPVIAIALAIKLTDFGPILFSQKRVGRGGRIFNCYKFRSMVPNAEALKAELMAKNHHQDSKTFKDPNDPRITRVGRFLRKLSLDEFPQLLNVLIGEMSLVGPRPPLPAELTDYTAQELLRLSVPPGLTCIWQVSGRGDLPFEKQYELDMEYINRRSLWLDGKLLAMTVPAVLSGRGAY